LAAERLEGDVEGHVGLDGGEKFGEANLLGVLLDALLERTLQLVGVGEQPFHAAKLRDELRCRLGAHARAAGDVVARVAHEGKVVDDGERRGQAVFGAHFRRSEHLPRPGSARRPLQQDAFLDELGVVLVGRNHAHLDVVADEALGHRSDDVVGLVALQFENGDAIGANDVLDDGHGAGDVFGLRLTLRLVVGVGLVAERGAVHVESHGDKVGLLLAQQFVEGVHKAIDRRSVLMLRIDDGRRNQTIISAIDERVSVEKIEPFHSFWGLEAHFFQKSW